MNATAGHASARLGHIITRGDVAETELRDLCERIIITGSPASVLTVINRLTGHPSGQALIHQFMNDHFTSIIANAGRGRTRQVIELANRCWTLGYPHQARALRSCLPRDGAALGYFLRRSPRRFVNYLAAVRDADPAGLAQLLSSTSESKPVVESLVDRLENEETSVKIICQIAAMMPRPVVREFLEAPQVTGYFSSRPPWQIVFLLRLMATKHMFGAEYPANRLAISSLQSRAAVEPVELYNSLPYQLHECGLSERPELRPVIESILQAVQSSDDDMSAQQILWDIAQYFPHHRVKVKEVAEFLLTSRAGTSSGWSRLCLIGILQCLECAGIPRVSMSDVDHAVRDFREHRWELLRVVLACARAGDDQVKHAESLFSSAVRFLSSTSNSDLGKKLLTDVKYALDGRLPVQG
jgi:hypothetical protein